jgi:uracil-DNA glycosylase
MNWKDLIKEEKRKDYFLELESFLESEYRAGKTIYPPKSEVFTAFELTPFEQVKVVILGQDPYHGHGQAHGLAFSVKEGVKLPPSLRNIFKELHTDLGIDRGSKGDLSAWARQGVLLLNTILTVEEGRAGSHQKKGWEIFTDTLIKTISDQCKGVIFILWGAPAQTKKKLINTQTHHVIESVHPSPLSSYRGFFGSKPFSQTNHLLKNAGKKEINWHLV